MSMLVGWLVGLLIAVGMSVFFEFSAETAFLLGFVLSGCGIILGKRFNS